MYVKGKLNKITDCLSRYFDSDTSNEHHNDDKYINANMHIDS